ncbi:MAG: outer membrane protein assembly factor [gamma proteobacterium endosymbiont of Lamellibrachia anaximandri]|nr:outer membrane protein assembly factor [gamma proteobacterium endosymbiont of Lamellibrachia anaximandri]MBL3534350.1 outer membrane protein assembly factor [gamma proteobacterium endosymbiont of Lamellibrachia anaximandri]
MHRFFVVTCLLLTTATAHALDIAVQIEGLDGEQEANVRAFLSLEQEKTREGLTEGRLRLLHREAPAEIRRALQPFGHFKPKIESKLEQNEAGFQALYQIQPGPRIKLAKVEFNITGPGRDDTRFSMGLDLHENDFLDQTRYRVLKQQLLSDAIEAGYLDASYSIHKVRVDLDSYQAEIQLELESGPQYRFGDVRFVQEILNPEFLARYLRFRPGDPFSHDQLLTLQSNLIDSEYFSHVEVRTLRDEAVDDQVPTEVALTPNKPNRYRIGLGFTTDTGPRVTLDWKRRLLGHNGHRMLSELRLSAPHSSLKTEYIIPLERPSKDSLSFSAQGDRFDTDTRRGERLLLNSARSVGLDNHWRRTIGIDYSYEDFEVGAHDDNALLLVPYVSWSQLRSDGLYYIQRGHRINLRFEGAAEQLLSSTSYLQAHTNNKLIHGLGDGYWRILTRMELGATLAQSLIELPASKRFFAGGDNSVRGFAWEEIGPQDSTGAVVGGRFLAVGSIELERLLTEKWSAAVFADAGNAFDPDYTTDIEYSVGFGVRWHSPVGPIRVDLASALSRDEPSVRLHIVIGPEL